MIKTIQVWITWAECDSSHQDISVGIIFCISRRPYEKVKPRWLMFLSVIREGTSMSGVYDASWTRWCHRALVIDCTSIPLRDTRIPRRCVHYFPSGVWKAGQLLKPNVVPQAFVPWSVSKDRILMTKTFSLGKYIYEVNGTLIAIESWKFSLPHWVTVHSKFSHVWGQGHGWYSLVDLLNLLSLLTISPSQFH